MIPPVEKIQLGWPVRYQDREHHVRTVSRAPDVWIQLEGSDERLQLTDVEWMRDVYQSEGGEPARKVRLW